MTSIAVVSIAGLSLVQDGGRPGFMHQGIPRGGALVRERLARANATVDNADDEPAIETFGAITVVASGPIRIGRDDGAVAELREGQPWAVACAGARVAYVAVRGGLDVPRVLGGRGTLLSAGFGGHEGRALRRGDVIPVGRADRRRGAVLPLEDDPVESTGPSNLTLVRVVPGPDLDRLAPNTLERLMASSFRIDARSDRIGVRLAGPRLVRLPDDAGASRPMVPGAIQLPPDGVPIVLGPDHPTTGGYPVVAVVTRRDQDRFFALPVGAELRFAVHPLSARVAASSAPTPPRA